jgi:uncharacterized membrane protein (DUF4010 family)
MGGLVTSTTVTWTFARLVRRHSSRLAEVATAILAAWIVSLLRMTAIAIVVAPGLKDALVPPIAAASLVLAVPAVIAYLRAGRQGGDGLPITNPLELAAVLKFGALLAAIMVASKLVGASFGDAGLSVLGGVSGTLDVDPITLSMARLVRNGSEVPVRAASVILLAGFTNAVTKAVLGWAFGGARLGLLLAASMLAASGAGLWFFLA